MYSCRPEGPNGMCNKSQVFAGSWQGIYFLTNGGNCGIFPTALFRLLYIHITVGKLVSFSPHKLAKMKCPVVPT